MVSCKECRILRYFESFPVLGVCLAGIASGRMSKWRYMWRHAQRVLEVTPPLFILR